VISSESIYPIICYLALVTSTDGKWDKHPTYLLEKTDLIQSGLEAFAALDFINQTRVIEYCGKWSLPVPKPWANYYDAQAKAARALGIEL
jgi:hypothetical protein